MNIVNRWSTNISIQQQINFKKALIKVQNNPPASICKKPMDKDLRPLGYDCLHDFAVTFIRKIRGHYKRKLNKSLNQMKLFYYWKLALFSFLCCCLGSLVQSIIISCKQLTVIFN